MTKYVALLVLFPLLLKSSLILGFQDIDPMLTVGGVGLDIKGSFFPGLPTIDPNIGYTTQALGMRAAQDWWHGQVPWWNPYEGTGVPLAAEMQCAAFFLPFILMMAWPGGLLWFQLSLQIMAGLATFALLRRLNLGVTAALVGGLLYEVNGTFAWLATVSDNPIPFLPLLLYGIETARLCMVEGRRGGWGWIAAAIAWSLYAGFPETAYIDGLLAFVWSAARLAQLSWSKGGWFVGKLCSGFFVGVLLGLPILVPFAYHVTHAFSGGHALGSGGIASLSRIGVPALFLPYVYGPIFAPNLGPEATHFWKQVGGYAGSALPILGLWSLWAARERILRWALAGWAFAACLKSFGLPIVSYLLNHVPFLRLVAFFRYSPPSWEFCLVVLTAFTIDDICRGEFSRRNYVVTAIFGMALISMSLLLAGNILDTIAINPTAQMWFFGALALAGTVGLSLSTVPWFLQPRLMALVVSVLALSEATLLFMGPVLATPESDRLDAEAVGFLSKHIGLQRFYSLGPFAPNYGSAFAIAQIDWNAVMIENHLVNYMHQNLDPNSRLLIFNGLNRLSPELTTPSPVEIFNRRVHAYEQAGVAYVIVPPGTAMEVSQVRTSNETESLRAVYADDLMAIYALPHPRPYFSAPGCQLKVEDRNSLQVVATEATQLTRLESYYEGWTATVNGQNVPIERVEGLFQQIQVPPGTSQVRFSYRPLYLGWAMAGFILGALILCWEIGRSLKAK